MTITDIRIRLFNGESKEHMGWASCIIDNKFFVNAIAIKKKDGVLYLVYPKQISKRGTDHFYFNPITTEARIEIEQAILDNFVKEGGSNSE